MAGKYQVLALNRGQRHGLKPGDALGVYYRGELVRDRYGRQNWSAYSANYDSVRLPDERSATVMVFQVYDRMSYALVMQSTQVIRIGDFVFVAPLFIRRPLTAQYIRMRQRLIQPLPPRRTAGIQPDDAAIRLKGTVWGRLCQDG